MYLYLLFVIELLVLFFLSRKVTRGLGSFIYKITKNEKWTVYIMSIFFLPGTFIHEVAHFLSALILLVPVRQIELVPQIEEGKVSLGRVPIAKVDFVRRTLVGIAPLVFGVSIIFGTIFFITSRGVLITPLYTVLAGYLVFEVGNTMYLSKKDLDGSWVFFTLLILAFTALYFLGLRISGEGLLAGERALNVITTANIYLLVPIILDIAILSALSLFRSYN
jgi:hypothetical protein